MLLKNFCAVEPLRCKMDRFRVSGVAIRNYSLGMVDFTPPSPTAFGSRSKTFQFEVTACLTRIPNRQETSIYTTAQVNYLPG